MRARQWSMPVVVLIATATGAPALSATVLQPFEVQVRTTVRAQYLRDGVLIEEDENQGTWIERSSRVVVPEEEWAIGAVQGTALDDTLNVAVTRSGYASAGMDVEGNTEIVLDAQVNDSISDVKRTFRAEVVQEIRPSGSVSDLEMLSYSFRLTDRRVEFWDPPGVGDDADPFDGMSNSTGARMWYEVKIADDATAPATVIHRDEMRAWHDEDRDPLFTPPVLLVDEGVIVYGSTITGVPAIDFWFFESISDGVDVPFGMGFNDIGYDNPDGSFDAPILIGDTPDNFWMTVTMGAELVLPPFLGAGARVTISDPSGLSGIGPGGLSQIVEQGGPAPIPLPPAIWLLGSALISLRLLSTRRRWA